MCRNIMRTAIQKIFFLKSSDPRLKKYNKQSVNGLAHVLDERLGM